jgi:hypothetical protein
MNMGSDDGTLAGEISCWHGRRGWVRFSKQDIARMFAYAQADALKMMRSGFPDRIPQRSCKGRMGQHAGLFHGALYPAW